MSKRVDLVFFEGCPNAAEARQRIEGALAQLGLPKSWDEWDTMQPETPEAYTRFGSPTVLVDGKDVTALPAAELRALDPARKSGATTELAA